MDQNQRAARLQRLAPFVGTWRIEAPAFPLPAELADAGSRLGGPPGRRAELGSARHVPRDAIHVGDDHLGRPTPPAPGRRQWTEPSPTWPGRAALSGRGWG